MNQDDLDKVRLILTYLGFPEARIDIEQPREPSLHDAAVIHIKHQNARHLIGPGGEHLAALERVLRCMLNRQKHFPKMFVVDVNGYRRARRLFLRAAAENAADQVRLFRRQVALGPMSRSERRIIHVSVADIPGVYTESKGTEPYRHVVVKPRTIQEDGGGLE